MTEDKANLLNTFFCSISEIIDSDLPTPVFDNRTGRKLVLSLGATAD